MSKPTIAISTSPLAFIAVGDRVRFTRAWLQSTGSYTGQLPRLTGTVTEVRKLGTIYVKVLWDQVYFEERETMALASNLQVIRR